MQKRRKVEKWTEIVRSLGLDLMKPLNYVSVDDIKRIAEEEPRLMAYIDTERKLPRVFRDHGVFLLPVSSTHYAIVKGEGFHELEPVEGEPRRFLARYPFDMTTLAYGTGETGHLTHAYNSGLLSHFTSVNEMYQTVTGRMGTSRFDFRVEDSPVIHVKGVGMEVDMGFEGREDVLLFEAKARPRESFLIRQLYYPFRAIGETTDKSVRSFFFIADPRDETYCIWEYRFEDPFDYGSVRLVRSARYSIEEEEPPVESMEAVEPDLRMNIVPQANDFQKVADFPLLVDFGIVTAKQWAAHYGITERQGSYYREAAEAMGLVSSEDGRYRLTNLGKRYVRKAVPERADQLAQLLLSIPLMNTVFKMVHINPLGVSKEQIAGVIARTSHLTGKTPMRRASTILSYFRWLSRSTGTVVVKSGRVCRRPSTLDNFKY